MGCVSVRRYHHYHLSAFKSGFSELVLIGCYRKFGNLIKCLFFCFLLLVEKRSVLEFGSDMNIHEKKVHANRACFVGWLSTKLFLVFIIFAQIYRFLFIPFLLHGPKFYQMKYVCMYVLKQTCEYNICIQICDILTKQHNSENLFLQKRQKICLSFNWKIVTKA